MAGGNGTLIFKSRRNERNKGKCLRHRLRTEYVGHTEITEITESAFGTGCAQRAKRKISFISFISAGQLKSPEDEYFCEYLCEIRISLDDYG